MSDLDQVLRLWRQMEATDEDCVLATIIRVEGSSYRKPGARMLITKGGLRAGTVSGGCLEAEVSKQAWWLTANGPVVKEYSTSFETDGDRPYGLGCGGRVHLLLERRVSAEALLRGLSAAFERREPLGCAVVTRGATLGRREIFGGGVGGSGAGELMELAREACRGGVSFSQDEVWAEYIPPRTGLFVFGAGDDAKPLVVQAKTLGWHVTVADGRSHLATRARFPEADEVVVLRPLEISGLGLRESDAVVLMTHSYEQDVQLLRALLQSPLRYMGVLGPRYRTADLLREVGEAMGGVGSEQMKKIHSPVGLDLGGDSPATIALAILAEVQATVGQLQKKADRERAAQVV